MATSKKTPTKSAAEPKAKKDTPKALDRAEVDEALARASAAEARATAAEARAVEAEQRALAADAKAVEAATAATAADVKTRAAEAHGHDIEIRLRTVERELHAAEPVIADLRHTSNAHAGRAAELEKELATARQALMAFKVRCPKCGQNLAEETYEGITIDRCGGCGGVWLDPGETEMLVQKIAESHQKPGFWAGLFKRKPKGSDAKS